MSEQTLLAVGAGTTAEPPASRHRFALTIIVTCQLMLILDATVMNCRLP